MGFPFTDDPFRIPKLLAKAQSSPVPPSSLPIRSSANVRINQLALVVLSNTPGFTPPSTDNRAPLLPDDGIMRVPRLLSRIGPMTGSDFSSIPPPPPPPGGPSASPLILPQPPPFSVIAARFASVNATAGNPGNLRMTQDTMDVTVAGPANLRETQVSMDVEVVDAAALRVTQDTADVTLRVAEHYRVTQVTMDVLIREGPLPPPPPPPPPPANNPAIGPTTATVYSLDRQVFEPLQQFQVIVRAATIETAETGVTWNDLPNPWSTYLATWDSFFAAEQQAVFLGLDDGTETTWADLPNPWSTYLQSWNSFPAGGNVDTFSDNSTTDAGLAIPYSMTPALVYESSRQNILLDSWDFILKVASFFELLTVEFDSLRQPLSNPVPVTATAISLNDKSTFSVPKAYPGPTQNVYRRYIRVTMSGLSFSRSFAFGGATVFVQIQERPSKPSV